MVSHRNLGLGLTTSVPSIQTFDSPVPPSCYQLLSLNMPRLLCYRSDWIKVKL